MSDREPAPKSHGRTERRAGRPARTRRDDEPVLPSVSRDETDEGWAERGGERDADWYRRERPPHHE